MINTFTAGDNVVLQYVRQYIKIKGYPPSVRELAAGCYYSTTAVLRHLDRLEAMGYLRRDRNKSRGIALIN